MTFISYIKVISIHGDTHLPKYSIGMFVVASFGMKPHQPQKSSLGKMADHIKFRVKCINGLTKNFICKYIHLYVFTYVDNLEIF